ncbi:MAG: T9SS type A sorting domain-containing protein, partial [Nitrososphaera sp.]
HQLQKTGLYTAIVHDYSLNDAGEYNLALIKIPADLRPGIYNPSPKSETTIIPIINDLNWDRVDGATGYDVYFGTDIVTPLEKIGVILPSPSMSFPKTEPRQVYYWHVVAHTPNGEVKGPYWWFLNCSGALAAPSALAAEGKDKIPIISLKWQDNSANETGFEIERKTETGSFNLLATVAANATTFADTSVMLFVTYTYRVRAINPNDGLCTFSDYSNESTPVKTSVTESANVTPLTFELRQNYPNPFNPSTTIKFSLPSSSRVTLKVFDLLGKEIATLVDQDLTPGRHETLWDASGIESGVYFYQLRTGEFVETKRLVLVK